MLSYTVHVFFIFAFYVCWNVFIFYVMRAIDIH